MPQPESSLERRRCKRKTECNASTEDAEEQLTICEEAVETLQDLSRVYGSDAFADVLALLRSVEPYTPNWQQATTGDCILRLLRDASSGRFVQQKVKNTVTLSTIHQAKGLEWQVVILARANEGWAGTLAKAHIKVLGVGKAKTLNFAE